jgi:Glycosyltransferase family 87
VQAVWGRLQLTELQGAIVAPAVTMLIVASVGGVALLIAYLYWRDDAARLRLACLIIFLIAAAIYYIACHWFVFATNMHDGSDLRQDYVALQQWQAGGLPYSLSDTISHPGTAVKLPPIFAYMMLPQMWAGQSFAQLLYGWRVGNELIYLLAVWLTLRAFDIRLRSEAGGAAVWLALCSAQAAETVAWGQYNIIMLASIAGTLWLIRKGRLAWSGAALSLAVMLKFFPLTMALPWLMKRRGWTGLGGLAAGFIALALLPIPLLGGDTVYYYWTQIFPNIGGGADEGVSNQSLYGMVARLAVVEANLKHNPPGAWWVLPIVFGSGLTLILLSAWLAYRRTRFAPSDRSEAPAMRLLPYLLCLTLGLLISPFSWAHYETALLPAIVGLLLLIAARSEVARDPANPGDGPPAARGNPPTSVLPVLFGVMFALIGYGGRYDLSGNYAVGLDLLGVSYHSFGLILLLLMLGWLLWRGVATVVGKRDAAEPPTADTVAAAAPALAR